ncbi:hypothetical protein DERP_000840 [Dermatophagoides pteronyssinus]|uniref:Uncharacterized protein n=1 Tax=Dermatophagoides pteronyssinus TaxID=6956 RepID=A0ABQ8J1G7_DERPT|nr:hypothetical protein DERP_000840 [Dermatophagoides pteronyssinus]
MKYTQRFDMKPLLICQRIVLRLESSSTHSSFENIYRFTILNHITIDKTFNNIVLFNLFIITIGELIKPSATPKQIRKGQLSFCKTGYTQMSVDSKKREKKKQIIPMFDEANTDNMDHMLLEILVHG